MSRDWRQGRDASLTVLTRGEFEVELFEDGVYRFREWTNSITVARGWIVAWLGEAVRA